MLIVLGAPPVIGHIATGGHSSTRATSVSGTNLVDLIASAGPTAAATPQSARAGSTHPVGVRSANIHCARSGAQAYQSSDSEIDIPIFSSIQDQKNKCRNVGSGGGGSLNEIFDAVADEFDGGCAASPLNIAAGSGRSLKKQLSFTDS